MSKTINSLFEKPINRHIEGVIKADDESDLANEVSEYVVTKEIATHLIELLAAYHAGGVSNGVWISGFFGSGKSHLLKILSLLLENRQFEGNHAADLFLPKLNQDPMLKADFEKAIKIPSKSVRFNIDQKADLIAKDQADALLSVFVKVFNELRGYYPKQGYIAELEAELDARGDFQTFKNAYQTESKGRSWEEDRDVVHTLENETFARAYAKVTGTTYEEALKILDRKQSAYKVSIEDFGESVRKWLDQQPKGFRLNFFVDEVGQFVGTSSKLMLNLQTLAETLATKCKGHAWIFVTSQGDLQTILGELKKTDGDDFSKILGRFKIPLNLTSQDVAEVICQRLLAKSAASQGVLSGLYSAEKNNLKTLFQFEDGTRRYRGFTDETDFSSYYPFHPYQFDLLQSSLISLSKHGFFTGRYRSIGERSMLGILQDVTKAIAAEPVGRMATFDRVFDGLRNALRADLQNAIQTAERNQGGPSALQVRVLKALFLVKFIKEFHATPRNIAILLLDDCRADIATHEATVLSALNQLENDTYIQRNGNIYEFLTDDEKDIETEIKDTDIDETSMLELLAEMVFEDIIGDSKIRYEENKQDYPYTRRLDGQVFRKREFDLAIHVASPFHESYDQPGDLVAQSMGRAELLLILPPDKLLFDDLKLYRQTEKYVQQNLSPSLPETRRTILTGKGQKNIERRASLRERLRDAITKSRLVLNGNDLAHASTDPKTRIVKAFQDLVRYSFPCLRMIRKSFTEPDLEQTLTTSADDFFKNDDGTMGEAEQEILLKLQQARSQGNRLVVSDLLALFEKRPYGWPQIATLCLLARLFMRGKVELRKSSNLLNAGEALDALSNNRNFGGTVITLQEQFDSAAVAKLKKFHLDFFHAPNPGNDAKEVAAVFQVSLRDKAAELEKLASHSSTYPFLATLTPLAQELRTLADREWSHCLKNLGDFSTKLLDAKEDLIDPLTSFFSGQRRTIYDAITGYLAAEQPNFDDVSGTEADELKDVIASATPFKGNVLQQAKTKLDALRTKVDLAVETARTEATARIQLLQAKLENHPDTETLGTDERQALLEPFQEAVQQVAQQRLSPMIRQIADRASKDLLPRQLQSLSGMTTKKKPSGVQDEPYQYVSASSITVDFQKSTLETTDDLDAYLAAIRHAYDAELQKRKRITL